ncbi:agamous-like MADS-box protein AGL80 [Carica papaya]|uniref:agamous-like MADS-box protein AGL80 n=1 Tax=Carica papaya TaxID=3649 RepID=UPI000B8D0BF9|nr:agamous-like MADS-box protein AGL80 [Carica papaya]
MKKVSELSTLCDVKACAIIYSPYDSKLEVWPSPLGAQHVLADFKRMPEMDQSKKMMNQESILRQRITKLPQPQEATVVRVMEGHRETFTKIKEDHPVEKLQQLQTWLVDGMNLQAQQQPK